MSSAPASAIDAACATMTAFPSAAISSMTLRMSARFASSRSARTAAGSAT